MTERPQFCEEVKCPFYGGSVCYIKRSIRTNWYTAKRRNVEVVKIRDMVKENPMMVINICDREWNSFTEEQYGDNI